jgi:hypothetical protein
MIRYVLAGLCALAGAAALIASAFWDWTGHREGKVIPVSQLWEGLGANSTGLAGSLFVPLAAAAVLALAGLLMRTRLVLAFGGLIGLATAGAFLIQQWRLKDGLNHLYQGWTNAGGGAALLIAAAILLPGRRAQTLPDAPERGQNTTVRSE